MFLKQARKSEPKNRDVLKESSRLYIQTGNFKEAEKYIREGLKQSSYDADFNYLQSLIYMENRQSGVAQRRLKRNLKLNPNHYLSYIALGQLYLQERRYAMARATFEKARLIAPENPETFLAMAKIFIQEELDKYPDLLFPTSPDTQTFQQAFNYLFNAKSYDNMNLEANLLLGQLYAQIGQCTEAMPYFQTVLLVNPDHRSTLMYEGYCDAQKAVTNYSQILKQDGNYDLLRLAREKKLKKLYGQTSHPEILAAAEYHFNEASFLSKSNYYSQSYDELRKGLNLIPEKISAHEKLMAHYRSQGDFAAFAGELDYLRKNTDEQKYKDMYEQMMHARRDWLFAREGVSNPALVKTPTLVYIFAFSPRQQFPELPDAGRLIAEELSFYLNGHGRVATLSSEETKNLSEKMNSFPYFGDGGNFAPAAAAYLRKEHPEIRFAISGTYAERPDGIALEANLHDLTSGSVIARTKTSSEGRGYLRRTTRSIAEEFRNQIPFSGEVLDVRSNYIVVNLGRRDLDPEKFTLSVVQNGEVLSELNVKENGLDILTATPVDSTALYRIRKGDPVYIKEKQK